MPSEWLLWVVIYNESKTYKKSDSQVNDSYEWLLKLNQKTELDQWSLIPELMILTNRKYLVQPIKSDSQANDSYEMVPFSESKTKESD